MTHGPSASPAASGCPVDGCPWALEPNSPDPGIGKSRRAAAREAAMLDERDTQAHLATHSVDVRRQLADRDTR